MISISKEVQRLGHANKFDLFEIKFYRYKSLLMNLLALRKRHPEFFYICSLALYLIQRVVTNVHTSVCVDDLTYIAFLILLAVFLITTFISIYTQRSFFLFFLGVDPVNTALHAWFHKSIPRRYTNVNSIISTTGPLLIKK